MTPFQFFLDCEYRGVRLDLGGERRLRYRGPARAVNAVLLSALAARKSELLHLLAGPRCPECRRPLDCDRCWRCHWRLCEVCRARNTSSAFLATCLACDLGGRAAKPVVDDYPCNEQRIGSTTHSKA
jgi:hypothetical protein